MGNALKTILDKPGSLAEIQPKAIPGILAQLSAIQNALMARMLLDRSMIPHKVQQTNGDEEDRLLTVEDVAKILNINKAYLYRLARRNLLPVIRIGKHIRIRVSVLRTWVEHHQQNPIENHISPPHTDNHRKKVSTDQKRHGSCPSRIREPRRG